MRIIFDVQVNAITGTIELTTEIPHGDYTAGELGVAGQLLESVDALHLCPCGACLEGGMSHLREYGKLTPLTPD